MVHVAMSSNNSTNLAKDFIVNLMMLLCYNVNIIAVACVFVHGP